MAYPIINSGTIPPLGKLTTPFRPLQAGLVNVVVTAAGSAAPKRGGGHPIPITPELTLTVAMAVFKPGSTTPVFSKNGSQKLDVGRFIISADIEADQGDLAGDWTVVVTNTTVSAAFQVNAVSNVTVRYQVVPGNIGKIDHIVVLMMENRSFDHLLGYLRKEKGRTDIDGLTGSESNTDSTTTPVTVDATHLLQSTYFGVDPGHGWPDVDEQLCTSPALNGGFVDNFVKAIRGAPTETITVPGEALIGGGDTRSIPFRPGQPGLINLQCTPVNVPGGLTSDSGTFARLRLMRPGTLTPVASVTIPLAGLHGKPLLALSHTATAAELATPGNWTCQVLNGTNTNLTFDSKITYLLPPVTADAIMGYHNAAQLPAYDLLASQFTVCDRWFASLPTDTWPNRLYSLTGGSGGLLTTPSGSGVVSNPPGFELRTIFEVLQEHAVDWTIFFSDLPFPLIFRRLVQDATYTARMRTMANFLSRAKTGNLPAVSWLDPNFSDVPDGDFAANDDHPPGDVSPGQAFVKQIYDALASSPVWSKTLFLITYDEHGGFYDHVIPPGTPAAPGLPPAAGGPADDNPALSRYGVRVPSFVISPWVAPQSVSNVTYDHTSLLRTILLRFCAGADGSIPSMGARTDHAKEFSPLLSGGTPRPAPLTPALTLPPAARNPQVNPDAFGSVLRKALFGF